MISSLEQWLALTPSVASLQALTSRASVRFRGVAPHHQSPTSAMQPAGQDLGAPLAPEINGQYRSNGARKPVLSGQCCRCRSATFDRRIAAADHSRETSSIATSQLTPNWRVAYWCAGSAARPSTGLLRSSFHSLSKLRSPNSTILNL